MTVVGCRCTMGALRLGKLLRRRREAQLRLPLHDRGHLYRQAAREAGRLL